MNTLKERIKMFCDRQKLQVSHFEKKCGLVNGYVNNIRKSVSAEKLEMILSAYPMLNRKWLLSGDGFMLVNDTAETIDREAQKSMRDRLVVFISNYTQLNFNDFENKCGLPEDFMISNQRITDDVIEKISATYPSLSKKWLVTGLGDMVVDEYVTIYERIKQQFKIHKIDFGHWETKVLGLGQGTLSRMKHHLSEAKVDLISEKLPNEVDKEWILAGRRTISTAKEPTIPYIVRMYGQNAEQVIEPKKETEVDVEVHEIQEGTKGIVIPINLSRNPKMKLANLSDMQIELGKLMPSFKFMYEVQTHQLQSFGIEQGDWLMLSPVEISEVINNEIYFINSQRYGCMVRCFQWVNEEKVNLINIDTESDILEDDIADINDVLAITSILKICTSLLPFSHTTIGKMMHNKDKVISETMQYNKEMFEEVRKSGQRTDMLIDLLSTKLMK